jgi:hypothetical protein
MDSTTIFRSCILVPRSDKVALIGDVSKLPVGLSERAAKCSIVCDFERIYFKIVTSSREYGGFACINISSLLL